MLRFSSQPFAKLLIVAGLASSGAVATANTCYLVYDRNDQVIFRDLRPPVSLAEPIGPQVRAKWPGSAMVIVGDAEKCIPLEGGESRFNATGPTERAGDAAAPTAKASTGATKSNAAKVKPGKS